MQIRAFSRLLSGLDAKTLWNTGLLASADLIGKSVLFLIFIIYARCFGKTLFGYLSFSYSIASIFVLISDFGINQFIIREIASKNETTISSLWRLFKIKIVLFIPFSIFTWSYCRIFDIERMPFLYAMVMMLYFWIDSLHQFMRNIYRANENMHVDFVSRSFERLLLVVFALPLIAAELPLAVILCFPSVALVSLVYDFFHYKPFSTTPSDKALCLDTYKLFKKTLPFTVSHIIFVIYFRIDTLMLQTMIGFDSVGYYNAAYRIFEGAQLIPIALSGSLYPIFSRLTHKNIASLVELTTRSAKFLFIFSIIVSFALFFFSSTLVAVLYGDDYLESQKVLAILSLGIVFNFYYMVFTYLFAAFGKQNLVAWIGAIILLLNVALNCFLIPSHGALGAASSTVICDVLMAIGVFTLSKKMLSSCKNETY